jgi:hypothetical protein
MKDVSSCSRFDQQPDVRLSHSMLQHTHCSLRPSYSTAARVAVQCHEFLHLLGKLLQLGKQVLGHARDQAPLHTKRQSIWSTFLVDSAVQMNGACRRRNHHLQQQQQQLSKPVCRSHAASRAWCTSCRCWSAHTP